MSGVDRRTFLAASAATLAAGGLPAVAKAEGGMLFEQSRMLFEQYGDGRSIIAIQGDEIFITGGKGVTEARESFIMYLPPGSVQSAQVVRLNWMTPGSQLTWYDLMVSRFLWYYTPSASSIVDNFERMRLGTPPIVKETHTLTYESGALVARRIVPDDQMPWFEHKHEPPPEFDAEKFAKAWRNRKEQRP